MSLEAAVRVVMPATSSGWDWCWYRYDRHKLALVLGHKQAMEQP